MESVFNQSVVSNDIVIVFDGPLTIELENVIQMYKDRFPTIIKIIRLEKNQGLGNALNIGLKYCENDLVARMDTDDIAKRCRCEKQLAFMNSNPMISIVGSNISEFINCPDEVVSYRKVPERNDDIIRFAHKRNPFNHMTVMFRKKVIESVGGYMDMPLAEDYYLWVRLLQKGYMGANIQENLVYARIGNNMIKKRGGVSYARKIYKLRKKMYNMEFISFSEFMLYTVVHGLTAIVPAVLREKIYLLFVRK